MLRTVTATRYVTPLREGGSLPAIVEADDDGLYVLKFRGSGQGPKALIAELVAGEVGRALGLPVPEIVFLELDALLGRSEPDFEIQALIKASVGLNLGLDFLPGAVAFSTIDLTQIEGHLASQIVWFDAYTSNVDRTPRNTNMLFWHRRLILIDHGAALYFHHGTDDFLARSRDPFKHIKDHILLPAANALEEVDRINKDVLTSAKLESIVQEIPEDWLDNSDQRRTYLDYLEARLRDSYLFVEEAVHARAQLV
ncbi:MAG TPA: HipA family kinase [Ktedonobacteraceae bacterium]|nr:HipA family kinase [Ktedonobacteraceae bacterium]